jgi:hypothetical protein
VEIILVATQFATEKILVSGGTRLATRKPLFQPDLQLENSVSTGLATGKNSLSAGLATLLATRQQ